MEGADLAAAARGWRGGASGGGGALSVDALGMLAAAERIDGAREVTVAAAAEITALAQGACVDAQGGDRGAGIDGAGIDGARAYAIGNGERIGEGIAVGQAIS